MNYRYVEVYANNDPGASGTFLVDLNLTDPVSRFLIKFRPVGGSVVAVAHPAAAITRIELIDGSDVLYSLTGLEAAALNFIDADRPINDWLDYRNGGTPQLDITIDFGRWLGDSELAFVPGNFANPQLRITWNRVAWDASASASQFGIWAYVFDQKTISPIGFLLNKEIKEYACAVSGYEYTDIPTDYPLRALIIKGLRGGVIPRTLVDSIKLSEDNDKRIPIMGSTYDLEPLLRLWSGITETEITGQGTSTARTFFAAPTYQMIGTFTCMDDAEGNQFANAQGGRFSFVGEGATLSFSGQVQGIFPHGCIPIKFGDPKVIEDWYDTGSIGSLSLRVGASATALTTDRVDIVTQQLRRY